MNLKNLLLALPIFILPVFLNAQPCNAGLAKINLEANGVSAGLTTTGNFWWDNVGQAAYEVPRGSGRHAFFAGSLWMSGIDAGGNFKTAAQTYGATTGRFDFWPGPSIGGITNTDNCENWDRFFPINRAEVSAHLADWADNGSIDGVIPNAILAWPASGNDKFEDVYGFALPSTSLLAPFYDQNNDGKYEAADGDYPLFKGDEAIWWVYNDVGDIHRSSGGAAIGIEVQVMAYAFDTDQELLKHSTFYDFKVIYKGAETINDFHIGFWADPDIGCYSDDFVGCIPEENLAYFYNGDNNDVSCTGAVGYGKEIPVASIKRLAYPSSGDIDLDYFAYFVNTDTNAPERWLPEQVTEYHNYLTGKWRDGTPFSRGGTGYNPTADPYPFMFDRSEFNGREWTECTALTPPGDRKALMSYTNGNLQPGAINRLSFAVMWKPNVAHPCPDVDGIIEDGDMVEKFINKVTLALEDPNPRPIALFASQVTNNDFTFSDQSYNDPNTWMWDFGDGGSSTEQNPEHTYSQGGSYTVCLMVSNANGADTICQAIVYEPKLAPKAIFSQEITERTVVFTDLSQNDPDTWSWTFGDGNTATDQSPTHTYQSSGQYEVCLTASNGIGDDKLCKSLSITVSSVRDLNSYPIRVYPNPANQQVFIDLERVDVIDQIWGYDLLGQRRALSWTVEAERIVLNIAELPEALYFFELEKDNITVGKGRFVVNR